jgi:hypothetical protein
MYWIYKERYYEDIKPEAQWRIMSKKYDKNNCKIKRK